MQDGASTSPPPMSQSKLTGVAWGAATLTSRFGAKVARVSDAVDGVDRRTVLRRVQAAAEVTMQKQQSTLDLLVAHASSQIKLGHWQGIAFVEHESYDETQLLVRAFHADDEHAQQQVTRMFVVEQQFSFLVRVLPTMFRDDAEDVVDEEPLFAAFHLHCSPQIRAADGCDGECTAAVLKSVLRAPATVTDDFAYRLRVAEADECPANPRAESLLLQERRAAKQDWSEFFLPCLAHKVHAAATKTWNLQGATVSGIISVCKYLASGAAMKAFRQGVAEVVATNLRVVPASSHVLDAGAERFRKMLLTYTQPPREQVRRRAAIELVMTFFNGDWRSWDGKVVHACTGPGCCADTAASVSKAQFAMELLISAAPPKMFNRSNWTGWPSSLNFFLFAAGLNGVMVAGFHRAFGGAVLAEQDDGLQVREMGEVDAMGGQESGAHDQGGDDMERMRKENAQALRASLQFLQPGLLQQIMLLRIPLEPERRLMAFFIQIVGASWEQDQLQRLADTGFRLYRPLLLHKGWELKQFFDLTMSQFLSDSVWGCLHPTERFRSSLLRISMKPAAVCFQLLKMKVQHTPFSVFVLLDRGEGLQQAAERLLHTPPCQQDSFARSFLDQAL